MNDEETCPTCSAQIRYSISHDAYICTGCGTTYSWPMYPDEVAQDSEPAPPVEEAAPPEQDPQ